MTKPLSFTPVSITHTTVVRSGNGRATGVTTTKHYAAKKPTRLSRAQYEAQLANQIASSFRKA